MTTRPGLESAAIGPQAQARPAWWRLVGLAWAVTCVVELICSVVVFHSLSAVANPTILLSSLVVGVVICVLVEACLRRTEALLLAVAVGVLVVPLIFVAVLCLDTLRMGAPLRAGPVVYLWAHVALSAAAYMAVRVYR